MGRLGITPRGRCTDDGHSAENAQPHPDPATPGLRFGHKTSVHARTHCPTDEQCNGRTFCAPSGTSVGPLALSRESAAVAVLGGCPHQSATVAVRKSRLLSEVHPSRATSWSHAATIDRHDLLLDAGPAGRTTTAHARPTLQPLQSVRVDRHCRWPGARGFGGNDSGSQGVPRVPVHVVAPFMNRDMTESAIGLADGEARAAAAASGSLPHS